MSRPIEGTYAVYFGRYIGLVPEAELLAAFDAQLPIIKDFLAGISEEKSTYAYAEGKWTIKEVLQHIIDCERIFNYRALCFARGETASLPGFEEDDYAANAAANNRSWADLVGEFLALRASTTWMYRSFSAAMLATSGIANNNPMTALATGFTTLGHFYHHKNVIEERYL